MDRPVLDDVSPVAPKVRLRWLDWLKGGAICTMCVLHVFYLTATTMVRPFLVLDPYVFVTFSLCFGFGCALSRRMNWWSVVRDLSILYVLGGLVFASTLLYLPDPSAWGRRLEDFLIRAAQFRILLPYADFLPPYILFSIVLSLTHRLPMTDARRACALVGGIALAIAGAGYVLSALGPHGSLSAFYDVGFRCLQSMPLFAAGYTFGRVRQERPGKGLSPILRALVWTGALALLLGNYLIIKPYVSPSGPWKSSGSPTYVIFGGLFGILLILALEDLDVRRPNVRLAWLERLGQNSLRALWLQMLLVPCLVFVVRRIYFALSEQSGRDFVVAVLDTILVASVLWLSQRRLSALSRT